MSFFNNKQGVDDKALSNQIGIVQGSVASQLAQMNSVHVNTAYPPVPMMPLVSDYDFTSDTGTDNTAKMQTLITYVMNVGGGVIFTPGGKYLFRGTLYTHHSGTNLPNSPIKFLGAVPCYVVPSGSSLKRTMFIKNTSGSILGSNFDENGNQIISDVYRGIEVENIAFQGVGGTFNSKYQSLDTSASVNAIELRKAQYRVKRCSFYNVDHGIYQPLTVGTDDNYCDKSLAEELSFSSIGTGCINIVHGDNTIVRSIDATLCPSGQYIVRVDKGNVVKIEQILVAGKEMLRRNGNTDIINLTNCTNIKINGIYGEHFGYLVNAFNMTNCTAIDVDQVYIRWQYYKIAYGVNCQQIDFKNIYTMAVENTRLDTVNDNGTYSTFTSISQPYDYDFDGNSLFVTHKNDTFTPCTLSNGALVAQPTRTPNIAPSVKFFEGRSFGLRVTYSNSAFVATNKGQGIDWVTRLGLPSAPTFDGATGKVIFPSTGIFANISFAIANRISAGGSPIVTSLNPLTVKNYALDGTTSISDPTQVGFDLFVIL